MRQTAATEVYGDARKLQGTEFGRASYSMLWKRHTILRKIRAVIFYFFAIRGAAMYQCVPIAMRRKREITQRKQQFTEQ